MGWLSLTLTGAGGGSAELIRNSFGHWWRKSDSGPSPKQVQAVVRAGKNTPTFLRLDNAILFSFSRAAPCLIFDDL